MQNQGEAQEEQRYSLSIRIIRLTSYITRRHIEQLTLEVYHVRPMQDSNQVISSAMTRTISKESAVWMEDFYYNNNQQHDSYQFALKTAHIEFETIQLQGNRFFQQLSRDGVYIEPLELVFKYEKDTEVRVDIEISVFQNQDFLMGVRCPEVSLAGLKRKMDPPMHNAIEVLRAPKLNCFSCMDEIVPGFDSIQFFPAKFRGKNRRGSQV